MRTVWFHSTPLDLPAGTFIQRRPDWQQAALTAVVARLEQGLPLEEAQGRALGGDEWEIHLVDTLSGPSVFRCFVMDEADHPLPSVEGSPPRYTSLSVRVPVDRYVDAETFLTQIPRPADRERLADLFERLMRGESFPPSEAREVGPRTWDVSFPVKFAGQTTVRVVLGTDEPYADSKFR